MKLIKKNYNLSILKSLRFEKSITLKKLVVFAIILSSLNVIGQTTEEVEEVKKSKLSISGTVDAYYQSYLSTSDDLDQSFGTAFAEQSGFALGMGNLIVSYEGEKVGAVLDLVSGPRGASATFNSDIIDGIVNQAYVYWNVSEGTKLTMGRFNTFLGYEVISPAANFNYSTSYLFSNGPFSHLGLKADFTLSDKFSLMLAIMNPWDTNDVSTTGEYSLGAQIGYSGQFLNFYYDSGNYGGLGFEVDYTGGFDLSDSFFLGINGAYQTNDDAGFYGVALYPQLAASDSFSLGLRGEMFGYHAKDADDMPSVLGLTLTGSYTVENLIIKPEIRLDSWSNVDNIEPYVNSKGEAANNLSAFTLAAIYKFD